jgi:hypothetical protein
LPGHRQGIGERSITKAGTQDQRRSEASGDRNEAFNMINSALAIERRSGRASRLLPLNRPAAANFA